jgi:hypothetical protein
MHTQVVAAMYLMSKPFVNAVFVGLVSVFNIRCRLNMQAQHKVLSRRNESSYLISI